MQTSKEVKSMRRSVAEELGSYNDRNDGFKRTYFSDSKWKNSKIRKHDKVKRVKPEWKQR